MLENVKNLLTSRNFMKYKSLKRKQGQIREKFLENLLEEGLHGELWNNTCLKRVLNKRLFKEVWELKVNVRKESFEQVW